MKNARLKPMHRNSPPSSKAMRLPLQIEALGLNQTHLVWSQPKTCSSVSIRPAWNSYTLTKYRRFTNFGIEMDSVTVSFKTCHSFNDTLGHRTVHLMWSSEYAKEKLFVSTPTPPMNSSGEFVFGEKEIPNGTTEDVSLALCFQPQSSP